MQNMIFHTLSLQTPTQALTPPPPPPTTTGGHHEPPLPAAILPHREEHFNQSEILWIHLKDSAENNPSIFSFVASQR